MDEETGLCVLCTLPKLYNDKLANKKKTGFLKRLRAQLEWDWSNVKEYGILRNCHIHQEVSEASTNYCIEKEYRNEENDTEEQGCSAGHGRRTTPACCSESPLSP